MREPVTYFDYIKAAFNVRAPIKGIGELPVNWLALGALAILGIPLPFLWPLGAAAEIGYLFMLSGNQRFQRLVDQKLKADRQASAAQRRATLAAALTHEGRERLAGLEGNLAEIQRVSQTMQPASLGAIGDAQLAGLSQLHSIFLRLLVSRQTLEGYLDSGARAEVEKEIERLEAELEANGLPEAVRKSKQATLDIVKHRLQNLNQARDQRLFVEAELARIEQQVALILDDAMLTRDPATLSAKIDEVATNLGETNEWIRSNADLLGAIEDVLSPEGEPPPLAPLATEEAETQ